MNKSEQENTEKSKTRKKKKSKKKCQKLKGCVLQGALNMSSVGEVLMVKRRLFQSWDATTANVSSVL